ncbi:ATP-binding response regulator [Micromonospora tarensis]|uniref:ATP-binding response regulator n=1 Tax=Micromonospora tarensis TaxID=2806100 RepID=UPI00281574CD|nr:ATP-binding protein [Micromonospora tarensis]
MTLPAGPWDDPVRTALALPLPSADEDQPLGVLLAGVSPSRGLDEAYRSFHQLLAQQISVALRNAQEYEEERRRIEALAELDRVKTDFFANVSHEFRTPLTLILGPLSDALTDATAPLAPLQRERVETGWRNATRLLTLVNSLLTFSSLEAGRARSDARVVDLAALTAELAGVFRAAVERAGLTLEVSCPPLPRPVAVDPVNWERIVTNLLSNALKYTFIGRIRVALDADDEELRLTVADTGIGIAERDLPKLFERFHRVRGARSRSHEGTGIGLALVHELARLEGGDVRVASQVGVGTTFTVTLPWSAARRTPMAGPVTDGRGDAARAAVEEAMGWLTAPEDGPAEPDRRSGPSTDELAGAEILLADDNADMRAYLTRLLTGQGWRVRTVTDGRQALDEIHRDPPDLVLTDVMMPVLDGFDLLRRLRADPATQALPVLVLSARAGGEASVEGLTLGADDYLVKPFAAAELIARVRAGIRRARHRLRPTGGQRPATRQRSLPSPDPPRPTSRPRRPNPSATRPGPQRGRPTRTGWAPSWTAAGPTRPRPPRPRRCVATSDRRWVTSTPTRTCWRISCSPRARP